MAHNRRIAIIGAGIIGISTAAWLRDRLPANVDIVIFAKEHTPDTTADSAAGLWEPIYYSETPEERLWSWSKRTWDFLAQFTKGTDHPEMGIYYQPVYQFHTSPTIERPFWADIVASFNMLEPEHVQRIVPKAKSGYVFTTLFAEGAKIIQYFYRRLNAQGVRFVKRAITSFEEVADEGFDLIVNCTGLGSKDLVPDPGMFPIRGQIHLVQAPWIRMGMMIDPDFYILPNMDKVIIGGTHQNDDWLREIRPEDKKRIFEGCSDLIPACVKSPILKEWVGLRPGRTSVRIDHEVRYKKDGTRYDMVHNYGHGGSGLTIFLGCAEDAANIALDVLKVPKNAKL